MDQPIDAAQGHGPDAAQEQQPRQLQDGRLLRRRGGRGRICLGLGRWRRVAPVLVPLRRRSGFLLHDGHGKGRGRLGKGGRRRGRRGRSRGIRGDRGSRRRRGIRGGRRRRRLLLRPWRGSSRSRRFGGGFDRSRRLSGLVFRRRRGGRGGRWGVGQLWRLCRLRFRNGVGSGALRRSRGVVEGWSPRRRDRSVQRGAGNGSRRRGAGFRGRRVILV